MAELKVQELLQMLIEDRKKREMEISEERERREKEFDAERRRREEEREARERESQKRLEQMQAYMDNLAKLVEGTAVQRSRGPEITVKLVPLNEKDDVEAYLITFERIMAAHNISKDRWPHYLTSLLTGKAQLAFAAVSPSDSGNYEKIKAAILIRELAVRLMEWQAKWLKECQTVEDVLNVVGKEQFLNTLPTLWVLERKPETCVKAGELADEYEQARRPEMETLASSTSKPNRTAIREKEKKVNEAEVLSVTTVKSKDTCRGNAQKKVWCARNGGRKGGRPMYKTGKVEGQKVTDILLDTGCSRTMVRRNLVAMEKIIVGRVATITCAHGDTKLHPLALVEVELDGSHIQVEAALSEELPVSVLLGTDVPELTHLISGTGSSINLQLEEELIRKEKELLSGAQSNTLVRVNEPVACDNVVPSRSESDAGQAEQQSPRKNSKLTKDQRREIRKKAQETEKSREGGNSEYPDITIEDLKKLQAEDPTLAEVLRAADRSANESVAEYFRREGLVYRRWTPKGRSSTFQVEQLVLPKRCRGTVLKLAHDVPLGGHLGKEKTGCRLLRRFYWPTLFKDVAEFCRGCPTCHRSAQRIKRAPLVPLPIITEPFSRVAMDIVGPLPRSRSGNKYILVLCDYGTKYPEAIPLKSIDAEHIAEQLISVFSRIGIPREILTDQGSNFTSQLLAELYRLLNIHPIVTSPYHPQTDGLVERFNQTLKSMLSRFSEEEGKNWDKMIPYILFAYREVPQATTGFSPFELLFGRDVRGPLDVLREQWESAEKSDENAMW
ncbi:hypothetical protein EMCRGX_G007206 [Ephydatia muelleri]